MTLASSLEDFSLAELFRMIDQGRKSGRLTLMVPSNSQGSDALNSHHIWFRQGRVVAAAEQLDGQGLISKITERGWLSQRVIERLNSLSTVETPLGLTLKTQGALQAEQLNLLFAAQMQQIWNLFSSSTGQFDLDGKALLPTTEMTGLSLPAMEVALAGLRALKDWSNMANVLPDPESAIQSVIPGKPQLRLNSLEWQVWEFTKGTVALKDVAKQLNHSTTKVRQAAFRLMLAGLAEEIPLVISAFNEQELTPSLEPFDSPDSSVVPAPPRQSAAVSEKSKRSDPEKGKVSTSFLQNLVGFLRSKA